MDSFSNQGALLQRFQFYFKQFQTFVLQVLKVIWRAMKAFDKAYPNTSQNIQLCFIYGFAFIDLCFAVLQNVFMLGGAPQMMLPFIPFFEAILTNSILKIWASPEKVFFFSFLVIEFMIIRPTLKFSKLIKYNVLLIFALLMLQSLCISYWEFLFHRHVTTDVDDWIFGGEVLMFTNLELGFGFFLVTFVFFLFIYASMLSQALQGKLPTLSFIPGMDVVTDSVSFWLKIRTPTMERRWKKRKDNRGE
jgi:hypothetical protein